jgi:hypothetical protein
LTITPSLRLYGVVKEKEICQSAHKQECYSDDDPWEPFPPDILLYFFPTIFVGISQRRKKSKASEAETPSKNYCTKNMHPSQ